MQSAWTERREPPPPAAQPPAVATRSSTEHTTGPAWVLSIFRPERVGWGAALLTTPALEGAATQHTQAWAGAAPLHSRVLLRRAVFAPTFSPPAATRSGGGTPSRTGCARGRTLAACQRSLTRGHSASTRSKGLESAAPRAVSFWDTWRRILARCARTCIHAGRPVTMAKDSNPGGAQWGLSTENRTPGA